MDKKAEKMKSSSPYNYVLDNPIVLEDSDGKQPNRSQATAIEQFIAFLRAHQLTTIYSIYEYAKNNSKPDQRYVYTTSNGWIDLNHVFCTQVNGQVLTDVLEPTTGMQFLRDHLFGEGAANRYYSYEDLPSNAFSASLTLT